MTMIRYFGTRNVFDDKGIIPGNAQLDVTLKSGIVLHMTTNEMADMRDNADYPVGYVVAA